MKYRSSHWKCSIKKLFLKLFVILTGKHLCWSLFLFKLQTWQPKFCYIYPMMMKLGTVISYLKKIQKYINQVTHPWRLVTSAIFDQKSTISIILGNKQNKKAWEALNVYQQVTVWTETLLLKTRADNQGNQNECYWLEIFHLFSWNKKRHWLHVSASKLPGD